MARNKELQEKKRAAIVAYFNKLDEIREGKAKKHTVAYCIEQTAKHFHLRPKTIENYLYSN